MLEIRNLGQFEVRFDDSLIEIPNRLAQSLLAYLANNAGVSFRRERLAGMFWPDSSEKNARTYLRSALWRARRSLDEVTPSSGAYLEVNDIEIAFNDQSEYWLDADMLTKKDDGEGETLDDLIAAVSAYKGELLPGFYDEWVVIERERLAAAFNRKMKRLIDQLIAKQRWDEVLEWGENWIALARVPEPAYKALMIAHAGREDRGGIAGAYTRLVEALDQELGLVPTKELQDTYDQLLGGEMISLPSAPEEERFGEGVPPAHGEPPYKGLAYFDTGDVDLFFGREQLSAELVARLREPPFLAVLVGASGSGKSSILRAGLLPALQTGAPLGEGVLPPQGSKDWRYFVLTPTAYPLESMARALTAESDSVAQTAALMDEMARDSRSLRLAVQEMLKETGSPRALILVDQFEEIFTLCKSETERTAFIENLLNFADLDEDVATVVIALRADFYPHCSAYPGLRVALEESQRYIGPMTTRELRQAIERPAELGGWTFQPGLVDLILEEVQGEPGGLPLLSHALLETWRRRSSRMMTLTGYARAGGVHRAIARTAESVYNQLLDKEQQAIARNVFLRLTGVGVGTEDTRRRVSYTELSSAQAEHERVRDVLEILADARLITLDEESVEMAHEALIREWPTLRRWLDEDRENLQLHRHLTVRALEWERLDRDPGELYRGLRLTNSLEWAETNENHLSLLEKEFLERSVMARAMREDREKQQKAREERLERRVQARRRALLAVLAVAAAVALGLSFIAFDQRDQAQNSFLRAERIRLASQAQIALDTGEDAIVPALLALRSLKLGYSPEADAALITALGRGFPLQRYVGHTDMVSSINVSPDQRFVVTASNDKTARLWSLETGEELVRFVGHADLIKVALFFPDGRRVLTGSADGTVRIWDVDTGNELHRFPDHDGAVWALAISPDGKQVLTSDDSGSAYIFDADTREQRFELTGHTDTVIWGGFSPDNRYVFTGSVDRTARLWDVRSGAQIRQFEGHVGSIVGGAFSPDGKYLVTASNDNTGRLWDVSNGQELQRFVGHTNFLYSAVFSPDGRYVLTGSQDRSARLWAPDTGEQLRQYIGHTGGVAPVAFAPDGQSFLTGSTDQVGRRWALQFDREPRAFTPPFRSIHTSEVQFAEITADGRHIVTGYSDGVVRLWDATTGQILEEGNFDIAGLMTDLVFSPDGKVAVAATNHGFVQIWDVATGQSMGELRDQGSLTLDLDISPDGSKVLTADNDGIARMWDFRSREIVLQFIGNEASVQAVTFSPDGKQVVTGSEDGSARLWDAGSGSELFVLDGHTGPIRVTVFSPDGRYVLTGSDDHSARLWDARTGREERNFTGHNGSVNAVAFSPDGRWVATGSGDLTARLWDRETGEVVRHLVGNTSPVQILEFSPDGTNLLTGTFDSFRLWKTELADVMAFACEQMPRDFTAEERARYSIADDIPTCEEVER
jgi:WD40 repeat protein/DNA-binding SARP family transcriptional activator